jgi:hypothetical protein
MTGGDSKNRTYQYDNHDKTKPRLSLCGVVRFLLPTLGANEYRVSSKVRFKGSPHFHGAKTSEALRTCEGDPIYLNPSFAEAMMGFPPKWTDLDASETPLSHKLPNGLGEE